MRQPGISAACTFALLGWFASSGEGAVSQTLYINAGYLQTVDTLFLPQLAFNETSQFSSRNVVIRTAPGDTVFFKVINKDSVAHGLAIQGLGTLIGSVAPGDSATATAVFPQAGVFMYYDPTDLPKNVYLGLAGMISVEANTHAHFFWNLHEHQPDINDSLVLGKTIDWSTYYPRYFTINGLSNPFISQDASARIEGQVGDTLVIQIAHTGRSVHSIHFHGYHATIVSSSKFPNHAGRSKDSVPIYPMETMTLRIVPDKPGEFPVHDHNLVAVSGGNYYPNGMFMTMLITP
jgi:FtsP/CotA-like multicopper oxidase with cupredoxin domain